MRSAIQLCDSVSAFTKATPVPGSDFQSDDENYRTYKSATQETMKVVMMPGS